MITTIRFLLITLSVSLFVSAIKANPVFLASNSGNQPWVYKCVDLGSRCLEMYPLFFADLETHLRGSAQTFENAGFSNGYFYKSSGTGLRGVKIEGPTVFIFSKAIVSEGTKKARIHVSHMNLKK